jgi:peptide/nickel transport system ATP-binding protein
MASPLLLEVSGLTVKYQLRKRTIYALSDVSFDVGSGETVGLVGESGSGKSTAAGAILGLVPAEAGSVRFAGEEITSLAFRRRRSLYRQMQIVFQDPYGSLYPSRTIGGTLAEPLRSFGERDRAKVEAMVGEMLDRVHLPREAARRYPNEFSGGQRQRISLGH